MKVSTRRAVLFALLSAAIFAALILGLGTVGRMRQGEAPSASAGEPMQSVQLGGRTIRVLIADTQVKRELGLGGREGFAPDEGMIFIFPRDGRYAFWMKDMRFSIDMIWLAADGTVVYMAQNVSPKTYPGDFVPNKPARYVLELPAGSAREYGLKIGDRAGL